MIEIKSYETKYDKMELEQFKCEVCQHNHKWIPVSDRLPKERETVLLQDFDGFYELGVCTVKDKTKGFTNGYWWRSANNYIAWMPLPEPYTEERTTDEI